MPHNKFGDDAMGLVVLVTKMFKRKHVIVPSIRDPLGSKTRYGQFLSATHRRCDVLRLVKIVLVVLEKILKIFFVYLL